MFFIDIEASHIEPSSISPSPTSTTTLLLILFNFEAIAYPVARQSDQEFC